MISSKKRNQDPKKQPTEHILALYCQCKLLVSTMSERIPDERTRYQSINERLTSIIAEKAYERADEKKLRGLFEEETALIAELSSIHFKGLEAFALLQEKSRKLYSRILVDHSDKSIVSISEANPDYFSIPLRSLASLETILRIYQDTPDAYLWKDSVVQWLEIAMQSEAWACDVSCDIAARAVLLASTADDFGNAIAHPSKWNERVFQGIKLRLDVFSGIDSELKRLADGFLRLDTECICAKTAEIALQSLSLAEGLPKRKMKKIAAEAGKAIKIASEDDQERIRQAADRLVRGQEACDKILN